MAYTSSSIKNFIKMSYQEEYYRSQQHLEVGDLVTDTKQFLSFKNIHDLHLRIYKCSISQWCAENWDDFTLDYNDIVLSYIEEMRADIIFNSNNLIKDNLEEEKYELIDQIKKQTQMLCKQTLELEMKVKRLNEL